MAAETAAPIGASERQLRCKQQRIPGDSIAHFPFFVRQGQCVAFLRFPCSEFFERSVCAKQQIGRMTGEMGLTGLRQNVTWRLFVISLSHNKRTVRHPIRPCISSQRLEIKVATASLNALGVKASSAGRRVASFELRNIAPSFGNCKCADHLGIGSRNIED